MMLYFYYCFALLVYRWLQSSRSYELDQLDSEQSHLNGRIKMLQFFLKILYQTFLIRQNPINDNLKSIFLG